MKNPLLSLKAIVMLAFAAIVLTGCGGGSGSPNPITLPISNAGNLKNVTAGTPVTLDGSASTAAISAHLTYHWTLASKPAGSQATLSDATSATPTLTTDLAGIYVVTLVVNDGTVDSTASTVTITAATGNSAPVANAGSAQNVMTGTVVSLDGSGSSDANGDTLTYNWMLISKPAGSIASTTTMTGATTAAPTFTADVAGNYVATLVVNDGKVNSAAATVTITATVTNATPVANAGPAQNVVINSVVTLGGSASSDANGDPLSYSWVLTSKPAGSTATLAGSTTAAPTFTADSAGTYVATLVVNDGKVNSTAATVAITATVANAAPVANAGAAQNVPTGAVVTLSGNGSTDANGDALTYGWTLTSKPAGSTASLSGATTAYPTFTADLTGTYVATLIVNDGKTNSASANVLIAVSNPPIVTVTSPATNNWARKTITVTGTVTSPNTLTKVELLINGGWVANAANLTAPTFQLDTTPYPFGAYLVALRATDLFGFVTTSGVVSIKVDNTPPTMSAVTAMSQYSTPIMQVSGTASDNYSGAASVTRLSDMAIATNGTGGSWLFIYTTGQASYALDTYRVKDLAGNCSDYNYQGTLVTANTCP